jgi:hypothetical protein
VWRFVNPVGDTTPVLDGNAVHLVAGAGKWHTMAKRGNRTVRIVQAAADGDLTVEVKFLSGVTTAGEMQGILFEQTADDAYAAFELRHNGTKPVLRTALYQRGTETVLDVDALPRAGGPMWLRVARSGSQVTVSWSLDGVSFQLAGTYTVPLRLTAVGVYSGNNAWGGAKPPAHDAVVDYFRAG